MIIMGITDYIKTRLLSFPIEPPRRVDDRDSQTKNFFTKPKKNAFILILFFWKFLLPRSPYEF